MSSATPFVYSSAAELLEQPGNIPPHYLYTPKAGSSFSKSPDEGGRSISAGDFSAQSTVTSLPNPGWTNPTTDYISLDTRPRQQTGHDAPPNSNIDRLALLARVASESVLGSTSSTPSSFAPTNMSTYISSSNAHAEALQTLHLMNPDFSGYGDMSNPGNLVLFNPGTAAVSGQGSRLGSSDQQHQEHLDRYTLPSAVTQSPYSHPSHMPAMSNTEMPHDSTTLGFYTKPGNSQGYNWGASGNEFSFLPSGHVTAGENNQQLSTHMNMIKPELSMSHISHYGSGAVNASPYHEQASLFGNGLPGHGANMDTLQAPSGASHILSLSLSPQQPSMMQQLQSFPMQHNELAAANLFHGLSNSTADGLNKAAMLSNKCAGGNVGGSYTVQSCNNNIEMCYQTQLNSAEGRHVDILASHLTAGSYGSKYLKPAQELLNEIVSAGQGLKGHALKHSKPQLWTGSSSGNDGSLVKSMDAMDAASKAIISWSGGKDQEAVITTVPMNIDVVSEHTTQTPLELSSAERQELQAKRAKLLGMRDEVDRRYKQYYHQMDMVARSFESSAGVGSAAAYTALALQTISKHFRCLRDAITAQIQVACKALGEEDACGVVRGETSKLRFIDQQLRQQHALRQLGMMPQQAWRPQRGLPEHSVSILRAWLFEHFLHPYPKDADKIMLAKQTGLNRNQVSNWFINARVRLWKPMVEEMYLEETKEAEAERADKSGGLEGQTPEEEEIAGISDGTPSGEFNQPFKQAKLSEENHQAFGDVKGSSSYNTSDVLQGGILAGSPSENLLLHGKEGMRQGVMKLTHAHEEAAGLLSGAGMDYKANKATGEGGLERGNRIRADDGYKDSFSVAAHEGFVQADHVNLAGYGSYQMNGLNRYGQDSFGASYAANTGVSLTLGLQHCDGLAFSGEQQHYGQAAGSAHLLTSRRENDGIGSADYYNVNEGNYEVLGLQSRKPFPSHILCHDFVV